MYTAELAGDAARQVPRFLTLVVHVEVPGTALITMQKHYDVLICGARVGGSSLALMLADLGHHVALIDRATFPSPANSTHFFRGSGFVGTLLRIGLLDEVLTLGSPPLLCEYWYLHGSSVPIPAPPQDPGEIGFNLSVRREPLDGLLVERARQHPLIDVRERTQFLRTVSENGRVAGAVLGTDRGESTVTSNILVGADGQHSRVAKGVDAPVETEDEPIRMLFYRYVRDFHGPSPCACDAGPEFSVVENDIAYAFPGDGGIACIGVSFPLSEFQKGSSPKEHLERRLLRHPSLAKRAHASAPVSKVMGQGREPNVVRTPGGPGWALVGDAGMRQDPWTGRGMDCAGVHAGFLADAIDDWLSGRTDEAVAMERFHHQRNEHGLPLFEETQHLGRDLRQMEMMQA